MLSVKMLNTEYPNPKGPPVKAAQAVSFEVPRGKFFTLLGPSGCGKTTTLRSIAGLERPTSGDIEVNGKTVFSSVKDIFIPPNRRNFGMVFQSYAIWPHMTVFSNVAFPLTVSKSRPSSAQIRDRVMNVLGRVALDHLAERDATKLSGGQQQRLALARAMVMEPDLLLLDEPLSNLDAKLRDRMRFELKRLQQDLGITTVYVTHDQDEALALSHEIAVMNEGRIVQIGTPREIYERPATKFVAEFIGHINFIEGQVKRFDQTAKRWRVDTRIGQLLVESKGTLVEGNRTTISIRPEDVQLSEETYAVGYGTNVCLGTVDQTVYLGDFVDFEVNIGGFLLRARSHPSLRTPIGGSLHVRMNPEKCVAVDGC